MTVEMAVYILCTATALSCAGMLLRSYLRTHVRLLLWTGVFFLLLTAENALLFLDRIVFPNSPDLAVWRALIALAGVGVLLFGLIWEKR